MDVLKQLIDNGADVLLADYVSGALAQKHTLKCIRMLMQYPIKMCTVPPRAVKLS